MRESQHQRKARKLREALAAAEALVLSADNAAAAELIAGALRHVNSLVDRDAATVFDCIRNA